jgi:YidC/Oxa1 family membrane protein insertase
MSIITIPFAWIMDKFYDLTGNYVISIFLFTLLFRLIMLPFSIKQQSASAKMARIQPKIKRIQEKYATNRVKMNEEMQKLYQKENYNPASLSGCLPSLVQILLIFPLINVIYNPLTHILGLDGAGIANSLGIAMDKSGYELRVFAESIDRVKEVAGAEVADQVAGFNSTFLGINISDTASVSNPSLIWLIPICACLLQLAVSYVSIRHQKQNGTAAAGSMGCMLYGMSIFSLVLCFTFPAGMGIYWISSSLIMLIQQLLMNKFYGPGKIAAKLMVDETLERREKESAIKQKIS